MNFNKESYKKLATKRAKKSHTLKNMLFAFLIGGGICSVGEAVYMIAYYGLKLTDVASSLTVCAFLIGAAAILTAIGVFDKIAKFAGAGTLLPITGFANSVVSEAIDNRTEGYIMGVGAKIFTLAGPVIVYGTLSGVICGIVYFIIGLF